MLVGDWFLDMFTRLVKTRSRVFHKRVVSSSNKCPFSGSTISTLLHDKINPKDCQIQGFFNFLWLFQVIMANPDFCPFVKMLVANLEVVCP